MITNNYYSQENHGPYELHDAGNFELEDGGTLRGCKLAYTTFGALNEREDNAILIPAWYSGASKIMEQVYIGQGRALDPDRYFIIALNQMMIPRSQFRPLESIDGANMLAQLDRNLEELPGTASQRETFNVACTSLHA